MKLEELDMKFEAKQLEIAKHRGLLQPTESVEAVASLWKYSMIIMSLGLLARLFQRRYLLVVTPERVLLIKVPAFMVHKKGGSYYGYVEVLRPCAFALRDPPTRAHQMGNPVTLPGEFAMFTGREKAFVVRGLAAQEAFSIAGTPPKGDSSHSRSTEC